MTSPPDVQFVINSIKKASHIFDREGTAYRSGMPQDGTKVPFGCPRGGTALIDHILENTLRMVGQLHTEIGQAIENHGYRLQQAAEHYSAAETQATASIDDVFLTAETTPLPPGEPNFE